MFMKRTRLSRKGRKARPVRLVGLRRGFAEGMQGASNKHLHQYASLPDNFIKNDPIAKVMKESAVKEIARRKALMKQWGEAYPSIKLTGVERVELVQESIKGGFSPVFHFFKNVAKGQFADELIKVMEYHEAKAEKLVEKIEKRLKHAKKKK